MSVLHGLLILRDIRLVKYLTLGLLGVYFNKMCLLHTCCMETYDAEIPDADKTACPRMNNGFL